MCCLQIYFVNSVVVISDADPEKKIDRPMGVWVYWTMPFFFTGDALFLTGNALLICRRHPPNSQKFFVVRILNIVIDPTRKKYSHCSGTQTPGISSALKLGTLQLSLLLSSLTNSSIESDSVNKS